MMQSLQIANRFREVILNGTWIANTNFKDQLVDSDWQIATKKVDSLNTISDLAHHIHYYISGILNVFNGGTLDIKDQFSFSFPVIESQKQWSLFLDRFWNDSEKFALKVESMSDEKLDSVFVDEKYGTFKRNIEAMIEHSYYHLGQIVLIKKMLLKDK
ncbi:DUF1572 family protein [Paenimyroides baculatum]|uniref:DUF1572 domain-containing protein n=1 Tax=Paenimyroides baculatum TaxID=2608000 RepID=A0A5M6CLW1_9FLAO|nr:DUF1572 family protein [Paenimyroides baculatum]KAA5536043.1 DUF1572 domain-containing protein [Paenimyroides baculatum]